MQAYSDKQKQMKNGYTHKVHAYPIWVWYKKPWFFTSKTSSGNKLPKNEKKKIVFLSSAASYHPLREFSATQNGKHQYIPSIKPPIFFWKPTKWKWEKKMRKEN